MRAPISFYQPPLVQSSRGQSANSSTPSRQHLRESRGSKNISQGAKTQGGGCCFGLSTDPFSEWRCVKEGNTLNPYCAGWGIGKPWQHQMRQQEEGIRSSSAPAAGGRAKCTVALSGLLCHTTKLVVTQNLTHSFRKMRLCREREGA